MPRPPQQGIWTQLDGDKRYANSVDLYVNDVKVYSMSYSQALQFAEEVIKDANHAKKKHEAQIEAAKDDRY